MTKPMMLFCSLRSLGAGCEMMGEGGAILAHPDLEMHLFSLHSNMSRRLLSSRRGQEPSIAHDNPPNTRVHQAMLFPYNSPLTKILTKVRTLNSFMEHSPIDSKTSCELTVPRTSRG
mmetsp:Transcript_11310/g.42395  ORF Transcript_11310/g.42395 Transcript_11310/m.42395 type:complete len:117 (+) Transcript_11310:3302-3652(+)